MEAIIFTLVAIALYVLCDRVLLRIEAHLQRRLEHRSLIFFVMLMGSALVCFALVRRITGA